MRIDAVAHFYPKVKAIANMIDSMRATRLQDQLIVDERVESGLVPAVHIKGWSNPHKEDIYHLEELKAAIAKTEQAMRDDLGEHYGRMQ